MKKQTKSKKQGMYEISLKLGDKVYSVSSDSIAEGLKSLKPQKVTLRGVFRITKGSRTFEKMLYPHQVNRIVNGTDLVRSLFEKQALITIQNG